MRWSPSGFAGPCWATMAVIPAVEHRLRLTGQATRVPAVVDQLAACAAKVIPLVDLNRTRLWSFTRAFRLAACSRWLNGGRHTHRWFVHRVMGFQGAAELTSEAGVCVAARTREPVQQRYASRRDLAPNGCSVPASRAAPSPTQSSFSCKNINWPRGILAVYSIRAVSR